MTSTLDAHARPPDLLRQRYKQCQRASLNTIDADRHIFDVRRGCLAGCIQSPFVLPNDIQQVISRFLHPTQTSGADSTDPLVYEHPSVPGNLYALKLPR